jgi:ADP-heptose:LPS heptosyltransferase
MKSHLSRSKKLGSSFQRIAVVRALPGLGDLLCLVPALRALRAAYPKAEITLIGLPWAERFVSRFSHYLNQWLEFPGYPGIPEVLLSPQKVISFLTNAQSLDFDLALQMHGNGSCTNSFVQLLGAKQNAGFFSSNYYCPDPDYFIPYPEHEPEIWRHLRLMEFLGIPLQGDRLEFPIWDSDWQELEAIATTHNLDFHNYVCVHPGASVCDRRWSCQNFATVADALAAQGLQIVLTGTAAEAELTQALAHNMQSPAIDLAGKTSLGALAALLKKSRLLICNDTGVSHLAAALQVSSVVLFSNSDPQRWAPLDRQRHRVVQVTRHEDQSVNWGIKSSNLALREAHSVPAAVVAEAFDLLKQEFAYAS